MLASSPGIQLPGGSGGLFWRDPLNDPSNPNPSRFFTIGSLITAILPYVFIGSGLILFAMLLVGGFEILTGATNEEKVKSGSERIKNALFGFLILFAVYWLAQIAQIIFKIQIL